MSKKRRFSDDSLGSLYLVSIGIYVYSASLQRKRNQNDWQHFNMQVTNARNTYKKLATNIKCFKELEACLIRQVRNAGARCTGSRGSGARYQVPRCQVSGVQVPGVRYQFPGFRCQAPGVRCQVLGVKDQIARDHVSGFRNNIFKIFYILTEITNLFYVSVEIINLEAQFLPHSYYFSLYQCLNCFLANSKIKACFQKIK